MVVLLSVLALFSANDGKSCSKPLETELWVYHSSLQWIMIWSITYFIGLITFTYIWNHTNLIVYCKPWYQQIIYLSNLLQAHFLKK